MNGTWLPVCVGRTWHLTHDQPHPIILSNNEIQCHCMLSRVCWHTGRRHSIALWPECLDQGETDNPHAHIRVLALPSSIPFPVPIAFPPGRMWTEICLQLSNVVEHCTANACYLQTAQHRLQTPKKKLCLSENGAPAIHSITCESIETGCPSYTSGVLQSLVEGGPSSARRTSRGFLVQKASIRVCGDKAMHSVSG